MGLAGSDRMITFLTRLLKANCFEQMRIPLGIVATDLITGRPVTFHGEGDVVMPIRASCAYPGLFLPIRYQGKLLVDGFVSMEVPAEPLLQMGVDRVISVAIPNQDGLQDYGNMFSVVSRSFQIISGRNQNTWRRYSHLTITPPAADLAWDSFASAKKLIQLGEDAALAVMPAIKRWLGSADTAPNARMETRSFDDSLDPVAAVSGQLPSTTQIQS
jgi:NTE family protein